MAAIDHVLAANRYCVLGTADKSGRPWVSPVFFAPLGDDQLCWVSSADARHSRNVEGNLMVAITVFDSTVDVGQAEAAYFDADADRLPGAQIQSALQALNARLPKGKKLVADDIHPHGPLVVYGARVRHRYLLVRVGDPEHGNDLDITLEV